MSNKNYHRPISLIASAVLACLAGACEDSHGCPEEDPAITMFTADTTTVAAGDTIEITVMVSNFELGGHEHEASAAEDDDHHAADCAGGHLHIYLDDVISNPLSMPESHVSEVMIPDDATAGDHTLIARLQNRDHTILEPQVTAELTITVQ